MLASMALPRAKTTASMHAFGAHAPPGAGSSTSAGLLPLLARKPDPSRAVVRLVSQGITFGRDPSCDVHLDDDAASRKHARVEFESSRWRIVDLGSRNGTIVDGARVDRHELDDGQLVRIGDTVFKFVRAGAEAFDTADRRDARSPVTDHGLIGGPAMFTIVRALRRVATSELSVVILGESGTGKELAARELHDASGRRGPFQAVNCAAIPSQLIESELFGYKRGAFSGADRDRTGWFKSADGGTLLLDEIGDLPLEAQAKLLRVLQTKQVLPVGATSPEPVDVRVVCATHQDLPRMQREGRFRGDLLARLDEYSVTMPPLRARKEDIPLLVRAFLARHGRPDLEPSFSFSLALLHYDWPFNVRELEATIKRAIALADAPILDERSLPDTIRRAMEGYGGPLPIATPAQAQSRRLALSSEPETMSPARIPVDPRPATPPFVPTESELRESLALHRGNIAAVGRAYGKERMQVHRWLKRYAIDLGAYRDDSSSE
jgi:DNA-binding NtrC family response regulator